MRSLPKKSSLNFSIKLYNLAWYFLYKIIYRFTFRFNFIRVFLLKIFGAKVSFSSRLSATAFISCPKNFEIGYNSSIGDDCYLQCLDKIIIGQNVCISDKVTILTGYHDLNDHNFALVTSSVKLYDYVWVAYGAAILPSSELKQNCIIGAFSLVKGTYGDGSLISGNPARIIKKN